MKLQILLLDKLPILLILASCSSTPTTLVTYDTSPEYGYIFSGEQFIGMAPQTMSYLELRVGAQYGLHELTVRWPSGAVTPFQGAVFIEKPSDHFYVTIERPESYPDVEIDSAHAARMRSEQAELEFVLTKRREANVEAERKNASAELIEQGRIERVRIFRKE